MIIGVNGSDLLMPSYITIIYRDGIIIIVIIIQRHWFLCVLVMTYIESETQFQLMLMEIISISLCNILN